MKKLFLHGELGNRFGDVWELNVSTPKEALRALFANEPLVEKYLFQKQKDGVSYGVKKAKSNKFIKDEEGDLSTPKDLHIFPMPVGAALGNLLVLAATTAASIYVSKQLAKLGKEDDATLSTQTQSFIYNGKANRLEQGSSVPLGYGRLKVGSNVVSSAVLNYDFNSESNKIFNFSSGLYSLIPTYSKYYLPTQGPLASSVLLNAFDGSSQFRAIDPAYQTLLGAVAGDFFGTKEALYGAYKNRKSQRESYTNAVKKGSALAGYFYYEWNFFYGCNGDLVKNKNAAGNWYPNPEVSLENFDYSISGDNALQSAFVTTQSVPQRENVVTNPYFYPISFADGGLDFLRPDTIQLDADGFFPIQVGQRFRNGAKSNGAGWFKLESVGIYKSVDLIGEGPIEGFSDNNGNTLPFKKNIQDTTWEVKDVRTKDDDFLRGVYLDDTPVKEVVNLGYPTAEDSYNINEFDIDVGQSTSEEMGVEDQLPMEPQYLFTANTKEIGKRLFGPRKPIADVLSINSNVVEFQSNEILEKGQLVTYDNADESYKYVVSIALNRPYETNQDYNPGDIVYLHDETRPSTGPQQFFKANDSLGDFKYISGNGQYEEGSKIKGVDIQGNIAYYKATASISRFKGAYELEKEANGEYSTNDTVLSSPDMPGQGFEQSYNSALFFFSGAEKVLTGPMEYTEEIKTDGAEEPADGWPTIKTTSLGPVMKSEGMLEKDETVNVSNSTYFSPINIISPTKVNVAGSLNSELAETIFSPFDPTIGSRAVRGNEEYYISHTIINPLVEEVYVSLQVDELNYSYEGDSVETTYRLGAFWQAVFVAIGAKDLIQAKSKQAEALEKESAAKGIGLLAAKAGLAADAIQAIATEMEGSAGVKSPAALAGAAVGTILKTGLLVWLSGKEWKVGQKIVNSGELWPNRARFRIKYGNEGEVPYNTDVYIYGVATSPYRKDVKIYLPPNTQHKSRTLKVYKLNYEKNPVKEGEQAVRYKELMSLAAVTEIVPVQLNYPNSVVIGTRVNARDVASIPERSYQLKLKKVSLPNNYNPNTRRYKGMWDGRFYGQESFTDKVCDSNKYWTDNPAWCLYDLLTNKRYGVGKFGIKSKDIDKWTLYKIAKYCDEQVPSGYSAKYPRRKFAYEGEGLIRITENPYTGSQFKTEFAYTQKYLAIFNEDGTYESIKIKSFSVEEKTITLEYSPDFFQGECAVSIDYPLLEPRYTINALLMKPENAFKLINEFAAIFRAYTYWSGGTINFFQDEEKEPVMLFANNNISNKGFRYTTTAKTDRVNSCRIKYIDSYNEFRPKIEYSEDTESIKENNIIEKSIDGFGITSPAQAKRAAEFTVKTANLETEIIEFETSSIGSYLRPGDIIDVVDNKRTIGKFAGKVLNIEVSGDGKAGEVDIDFPMQIAPNPSNSSTWKKINLYNISGNQTIESLDAEAQGGEGISDAKIKDMRGSQIGQYWVSDISHNDTKLHLRNNPYNFISGTYAWVDALKNAESRGGTLGAVNNDIDKGMVEAILPKDQVAWIGGYKREEPAPAQFVWRQPQDCTGDAITYFNWANGQPDPLHNYIAASGSYNSEYHGDWVTMTGTQKTGYILENKPDTSLLEVSEAEGTTFAIEDSVNLATPNSYKVINITEQSVGVMKIQGIQYNSEKFGNIEDNTSLKTPEEPLIFTEASVDAPPDVTLEATSSGGSYGLKVSWSSVEGATAYSVQIFNGTLQIAGFELNADTSSDAQTFNYHGSDIIEGVEYFARVYSLVR